MRLKLIITLGLGFLLFYGPLVCFDIKQAEQIRQAGPLISVSFLENKNLYLIHHLIAGLPVLFFGIILNWFQYRQTFWKQYVKPMFILSTCFILWDYFFTSWGIWGFNPKYYSGIQWIGLPIEEWIWFWIIPFCSLFIYEIVKRKIDWSGKVDGYLSWIMLAVLTLLYLLNFDHLYSSWSLAGAIYVVSLSILWRWKGIAVFMVSFLWNLIPMYLFNGMLTGLFTEEALVMYNPEEFSNLRLGSFPIEDLGFGFAYLYGIVIISKFIK
ncbi:MAG: lycopene cyclase domain-containing protein [Saprospiraceae bacterium]|nr:lycopene cyclase domain-containing protein [Saprospiraceae bacterium]